jgi:hypothetical protein
MGKTKFADALEKRGLGVDELSAAIGINTSWGFDLLAHESELYHGLSLRQLCNLASFLRVPPLSLLSDPPAPANAQRQLSELAAAITTYCSEHSITVDAFGDLAGWDVAQLLENPKPSQTLGVSTPSATSVAYLSSTGPTFSPAPAVCNIRQG